MGSDKGNIQLLDLDRGVLTIVAQSGFEQSSSTFFARFRWKMHRPVAEPYGSASEL